MTMRKDLQSAISGPFEQLARTIKGSPDQPRDDHGKWTSTGAGADHSKDIFADDDHAFVAKYGENFTSALNHLYADYNISASALLDLQAKINAKTPEDLVGFVESNYQGEFDDEGGEDLAKSWLIEAGLFDTLPKVVKSNLDLDGVGNDLIGKGGPLMSIYDEHSGTYHVFNRPTKG